MLEVVTEKTGYPTEMLELGMALDTDLGIDSIKRVEILAAMRERVPTLPEFDPNEMTALNTLGEIVDYMDAQLGERSRARRRQQSTHRPSPRASLAPDLHAIMLEVVTEKTGYPTEMLELGMALDTDLGIDSIKRVEILAAMRERVPTLPEFDPNEMTALNTLGEIVDYMDAQLGGRRIERAGGASIAPRPSPPRSSGRPSPPISTPSCWRSSPRRPATRPRCSNWAWRWTPTWASTPSNGSRSWPPCASECPPCPSSIPTR